MSIFRHKYGFNSGRLSSTQIYDPQEGIHDRSVISCSQDFFRIFDPLF